ncbi:MAG: hypothetical protein AAF652_14085 [Cyanobacteria bacterium P01_C01_bin.72]
MTDKNNPQQQPKQDQGDSETKATKSLQAEVKQVDEKKKRLKFREEDMIKIKYDF